MAKYTSEDFEGLVPHYDNASPYIGNAAIVVAALRIAAAVMKPVVLHRCVVEAMASPEGGDFESRLRAAILKEASNG